MVPDTNTFNLQNVIGEVYTGIDPNTAPGSNLVSSFADATGVFDYRYVRNNIGYKNNLLNFRNYNQSVIRPTVEPYIAPLDFDFDTEPINIYEVFCSFAISNPNAKLICSVGNSETTSSRPLSGAGVSLTYGQFANGIMVYATTTASTISWTAGSTKRHYIASSPLGSLSATLQAGVVWAYCSRYCSSVSSVPNFTLRYVHVEDLSYITSIPASSFYNCGELTGTVHLPNVETISNSAFSYCIKITNIIFSNSNKYIGDYAFFQCQGLSPEIDIISTVNTIGIQAFFGCTGLYIISILNNTDTYDVGNHGDFLIKNGAFDWCSNLTFLKCYVRYPPVAYTGFLDNIPKSTLSIWVRSGSKNLYGNKPEWSTSLWSGSTWADHIDEAL